MNKFLRIILIILVVGLVVFGIYYFLLAKEAADTSTGIAAAGFSPSSELTGELRDIAAENEAFLSQIASLKDFTLRTDLFSDPIFKERLIDSSFELVTEPRCRRNPFAPIGVETDPCFDPTVETANDQDLPLDTGTSTPAN
ncbi:MAG: hypothetical protein AAB589_00650 [Patescibacteria group bacterium]